MELSLRNIIFSNIYLTVALLFLQCLHGLSANMQLGPSEQPEAYFNGSSYIRLQTTINLKRQTALSFKSCTGGEIFSQIHNDNVVALTLTPAAITLSITPNSQPRHDTAVHGDYLDNRWHTAQLDFLLGNLTLSVDGAGRGAVQGGGGGGGTRRRLVANGSYHEDVLSNEGLYNDGAVLIVGNHYSGCLMEGPGFVFDVAGGYGHNVMWGECPIPDDTCVVKQELLQQQQYPRPPTPPASPSRPSSPSPPATPLPATDYCLNEPCMRHGLCINSASSYTCVCTAKYSGKNCEFDMGSPCERRGAATLAAAAAASGTNSSYCRNGGACVDDAAGNSRCVCPGGFSGKQCEVEVLVEQECMPNPCHSGGSCSVSGTAPAPHVIECACAPGYAGLRCETNINECASSPCRHGGACIDGPAAYECDCAHTGYTGVHCEVNVNECRQNGGVGPCRNGGVCFDTHGGYICECPRGWAGDQCDQAVNECLSQPCRNHGQCEPVASGGFDCHCLPGYAGPTCQLESRHGLAQCDSALCGTQAECRDTSAGSACACKLEYTGEYPNCSPSTICQVNPCLNGGICMPHLGSYNCSCPNGFTGSICERPDACKSDTCRNGGTCIEDAYTTFRCVCPETSSGRFCEKRLSCADNPCVHAVNCRDFTSSYYCNCESGWGGNNCDLNVNDCILGHCVNGATCIDQIDNFSCECAPGYTGERCHINIDDCVRSPCNNGGTCIDKINDFYCNCTENWMGRTCDKPYDACELKLCQNNATCTTGSNKHDYTCNCLPGFEGTHCDLNIDDCAGISCPAGKNCFDLIDTYECRCPAGLTGDTCTVELDICSSHPCMNAGTCLVSVQGTIGYSCVCPAGFTGFSCESLLTSSTAATTPPPPTTAADAPPPQTLQTPQTQDVCSALGPAVCNQGICVNRAINGSNSAGFQCYCQPGYTGERCDLDFDECLSQPCKNGAVCWNRVNNYECQCTKGYAGKDCSININECESMPCMAGSTCIDGINEFSCVCVAGLTGRICEINIDDCMSSPCLNGAACLDELNAYKCDCGGTGYMGANCEQNIDDCVTNPCTHGAVCVDLVLDYRCDCHPGYSGKNCHVDVDECESQPCKFSGLCLERSNATLYDPKVQETLNVTLPDSFHKEFHYTDAAGYECLCVEGVTGPNCETNINECESNPCQYGTCVDRIGSYLCECDEGYEGENCEVDINECEVYKPCLHGECVDKRANYFCICNASYGGKNCSVELTGCVENPCLNNGTCKPYLDNETQHKFNCTCQNGFRGATCEMVSTMSLNGSSLVTVNTSRDEGYDIQFRFKTTLPDGVLAVGRGLTFYILELSRGRLNLHSSLLNKWEGVFVGSHLNDSRWQRVFVAINASHLVLSANDEQTIYPITYNDNSNGSGTSFPTTYIGGYPGYLRKLTHGQPFLVGCTEDVVINGEWVLPDPPTAPISPNLTSTSSSSNSAQMSFQQVEVGCLREPQCSPNPCHSAGHCTDKWREFSCSCERPYLGHICQYTYTAATFGHENITDSLVTVTVTDAAKRSVRNIVDISMFVRTRQLRGQIFYLGSALGGSGSNGSGNGGGGGGGGGNASGGVLNESYIAAQLENGELYVRIQFNGTVEAYTVGGVKLNNGYNHLIEVIRNVTLIQVKLNGTEYFRKTISASGTLDAQVLYLGGQPQLRPVRQAENIIKPEIIAATGPAAASTQLTTVHFKGIIQDVQISDGSKTMVVEFFPLQAEELSIPMPFGVVTFDNITVLEGILSDDSCQVNPCHHYGVCVNTWNDYKCECTRGFKGKDCKELEFCKLEHCPGNSECRNLEDGYECIANATFNPPTPPTSPLLYHFTTTKPLASLTVDSVEVTYRSRSWGSVLFAKREEEYLSVFVLYDEVVVEVGLEGIADRRRFKRGRFDGDWTTVLLKADGKEGVMKGGFKDLILDDTPNFTIVDFNLTSFSLLLTNGTIYVAGSDNVTFDYTSLLAGGGRNGSAYVTLTDVIGYGDSLGVSTNTVEFGPDGGGVVGGSHHGSGGSLPWINGGGYKVDGMAGRNTDMFKGCLGEIRLGPHLLPFYPHSSLYNRSSAPEDYYHLLAPAPVIRTSCQLCHSEVMSSPLSDCYNGGKCIAPNDSYKCSCPVGYAADDCSVDIDECVGHKCENGATCVDLVGRYQCECVLGYKGQLCEEEIDECESNPCHHGGNCVDLLGTYRCECPEDYVGKQCEALRLITCDNQPCKEGSTCSNVKNSEYTDANFTCLCAPGMIGRLCDLPFCALQHCANGGLCNTTAAPPRCDCARGFEGTFCGTDVDDCVLTATGGSPCQNGGSCVDGVNRYDCNCTGTGYTGLLCEMDIDECSLPQFQPPCGPGVCRNSPGSYLCSECPPGLCGHQCALVAPCLERPCANAGECSDECRELPDYECQCAGEWAGKNCTVNALLRAEEVGGLNILYIAIPIVAIVLVGVGVALAVLVNVARSKRATRGTYSPSAQEFCNPRVELDHVLKPPPEERLI